MFELTSFATVDSVPAEPTPIDPMPIPDPIPGPQPQPDPPPDEEPIKMSR